MDSAKDLLNLALDGLMVFAPIVGYVPQYMDIQKSRNPRGFSTLVCFILLVSNVVRIFYWYVRYYNVAYFPLRLH